jgi:hypothetical protein
MISRNNTHIDKGINFSSFIIGYKLGVTVFNEAEPWIIPAKIPRKNSDATCRKRPHRQSSTFDHSEVTARGSADYPRVRHSVQKSPKGAAGIAQQVH